MTATSNEIRLDSSNLFSPFKDHVDIKNNKRIFFSGKFGTGKTTFLKDFFENHSEQFNAYHLFPVNYQINKDEDIVELLKYDILVELLKRADESGKKIFQDNSVNGITDQFFLFSTFLNQNYSVNSALSTIVSQGTDLVEVFDSIFHTKFHKLGRPLKDLLALDKEWQEFKKAKEKGDLGDIERFLETVTVREDDLMTHLINKEVSNELKETVLILDDLDRIDPEHIFRILNIFSAFQEREEGSNKFGFDKVIIVGDIENIKHIFHHFYGPSTDFTGYIDKFFSRDIYHFSNSEVLGTELNKLMKQFGQKNGEALEDFKPNYFAYDILHNILLESLQLKQNGFTLRQLIKILRFNESIIRDARYPLYDRRSSRREQIWNATEFAINVCKIMFEGEEKFKNACEELLETKIQNGVSESFFQLYSTAPFYKFHNQDFGDEMFPASNSFRRYGDAKIVKAGEDAIKIQEAGTNLRDVRSLYYSLLLKLL